MTLEVDLDLPEDKVIAIYGPSGSGKTTMLRMLAGLSKPNSGRIQVGDAVWYDSEAKTNLKPQQRSIGFVFQNYSLFPNMTIRQNVAFGMPKGNDPARVDELLKTTDLIELADRNPGQLSGGQQQRVALARALARDPALLLLDEPLSALDVNMRSNLQHEIARLTKLYGHSTFLVSHDISEVYRLADLVIVLEVGHVSKVGTPAEIFSPEGNRPGMQLIADVLENNAEGLKLLVNNRIVDLLHNENTRHLSPGNRVIIDASLSGNSIKELKRP